MEAIIVVVGFLGAGKTTFLRRLIEDYLRLGWSPYLILNDYENARLDSQQFLSSLSQGQVRALSGSCICCSGIAELRDQVNSISPRDKGVTLIEANGTSDACSLMEFLGVGIEGRFLPPVQVSIVDAKNWQKRGINNDLEANQVQVSTLVVLSHIEGVSQERQDEVKRDILQLNPSAQITLWSDIDALALPCLSPSQNPYQRLEHLKAHWSSCSIDLPDPMTSRHLKAVIDSLPESILRVKGCTRLDGDEYYSYFEKIPSDTDTRVRPYRGKLVSGPKLLTVGPGSDPDRLSELVTRFFSQQRG